ncbi:SDR family NAD(P)-dependent oxidoreductase, partial [Rhodococcus globerulus]|uniref:SDR family NAD(P)-dependent oxidoreductase n=1 Tax=Rhodococcus globerulus TaxID=33008 RepID=UPI0030158CC4
MLPATWALCVRFFLFRGLLGGRGCTAPERSDVFLDRSNIRVLTVLQGTSGVVNGRWFESVCVAGDIECDEWSPASREMREPIMGQLQDKVAVITGGSEGIGHGVVRAFAAEGARIVVADVKSVEGEQLVAQVRSEFGV